MGAGDTAAVRRIVPPDFDADQAIADKLMKYVGLDVSSLRTEYAPNDISPNHVRVLITGDTPPFGDVIYLERRGRQGWYVALGRVRGFTPGPTAQIRPP